MNYYTAAIMKNSDNWHASQDADHGAGLDCAVMLRTSWVRHKPHKRGGRTIKLDEGTTVALRRYSGSWWQIAYRDPSTHKITNGWIYESLVEKIGWFVGTDRH